MGHKQRVWGTSSKLRCAELVLAMLHDPTKVDPTYANAYRGIMDARRMLRKSPARLKQFIEACELADAADTFTGPMRGTIMHATSLGM